MGFCFSGSSDSFCSNLQLLTDLVMEDVHVKSNSAIGGVGAPPGECNSGAGLYARGLNNTTFAYGSVIDNNITVSGQLNKPSATVAPVVYARSAGVVLVDVAYAALNRSEFSRNIVVFKAHNRELEALYARGGGIYLQDSNLEVFECDLKGNGIESSSSKNGDSVGALTTVAGGAIYADKSFMTGGSTIHLIKCDIRDNNADIGGALFIHPQSATYLTSEKCFFSYANV